MFVLATLLPPTQYYTHRSSLSLSPHSFPLEKKQLVDLLTFYTLLASTVFEKNSTNLICIEFWIAYLLDNYLPPNCSWGSSSIIIIGAERR